MIHSHTSLLILLIITFTTPSSKAQTLTWDANGTTSGQPNGSGQWFGTNLWWNGTSNQNWDNSGSAIAQLGVTNSALVNPNTITITNGTANVGGINFMAFTAAPSTSGNQYTIAGSSGTLNFAAGSVINVADLTSTGSNFITFASSLLVTGNGLTVQKAAGSTVQQFMRFDMVSNPSLTGALLIKGDGGGIFFRSGAPGTFSAMSSITVENNSCFSMVTAGTYSVPLFIAGLGGNGGYGAIRVDTSGITISAPIALTADAGIQTNTGGITNTVISGIISGGFGFQRFATGSGVGTLALQNANTYTGTTTLGRTGAFAGGVTILDFTAVSAPTSNILYNGIAAGGLNLMGGNNSSTVLQLNGKAATANSQSFGNVTLNAAAANAGTSVISVASGAGGQMNLSLGTITRGNSAATLAVVAPASGTISTTQPDGFLGPWATFTNPSGKLTWAGVSGGTLGAFSSNLSYSTGTAVSSLAGYSAASHLDITDRSLGNAIVVTGTTNLATLTLNDAFTDRLLDLSGQTLRLGSTDTTSVGGILLGTDAKNLMIGALGSAGTLTSGGPNNNTAGQLFLTNGSLNSILTVNSAITNNGSGVVSLFINGASGSKSVLTGTNTFTGGTTVASGVVELRNAAALGSSGTVAVMEGAAIHLSSGISLTRALTLAGQGISNTGALRNLSGNNSVANTITLLAPTRFQSDQGTLTLTHSGGAASNILSGTQNVVFSGAGNIVVGSRLNISSATLTKEGSGMLTVSGDGGTSFTGATTITGGVLRMTSANGLATSAITVSENATIGSSLELSGGITVANAITFNGTGINAGNAFNGFGAVRNVSGNNTLSGILSVGLDGTAPRISADTGTTLTISGTLRSGATAAGTRYAILGGAGTIKVTGTITNGTTPGTFITGISKVESGTVNLRAASTFTPNTTSPTTVLVNVRGGTLNFDFVNAPVASALVPGSNNLGLGGNGTVAVNATTLLGSGMGGGTLLVSGKDGTTNTQNFAGTALAGGRSAITVNSGVGGTVNLALGPITRGTSSGSAVNITLPAIGGITTTTINTNGILNGGMTVGSNTWATSAATQLTNVAWVNASDTITLSGYTNGTQVSFTGTAPGGLTAGVGYYVVNATGTTFQVAATEGGTALALSNDGSTGTMLQGGAITGLATGSYSATFATNANVDVAAGSLSQAAVTVNSLRFNASGGTTLSLSGTLTNLTGGILVTPNVTGDVTIQSTTTTSRTLSSSTPSDFTVHHYGSGVLSFASTIALTNAGAFTKTGPGTMTFAGTDSSTGVQIRATEGTLNFLGSNQFTSATDPTLYFGSATTSTKVSFGNGSSAGAETIGSMYVLGSGSSLVGSSTQMFTLGLQNASTTDLRALMIGGIGSNENNLAFEAYSGGTVLMGAANTYAGRTNIGRSTLEVSAMANGGTASSIGTGATSPTIVMNDTTSTSATVSTLRYIGSTDAATDRSVQLYTDGTTMPSLTGVIENNGPGTLKFTTAFTAAGNTTLARTFRLSGTNAGANEIVSMTDGPNSIVTLDKLGTGSWTLTGTSTYTGGTTVTEGTLQLGNGSAGGMVGAGSVAISSGATLKTNRSDTFTLPNAITGAGSLTIANTSSGTTVLTSTTTSLSGTTTVTSGTLQIGSGGAGFSGSGTLTVLNGASLSGTGLVQAAAVNVAAGATLHAGDGTATGDFGTLTFTPVGAGTYDLKTGSSAILGIGAPTATDSTYGGNALGSAGYNAWLDGITGAGSHDQLVFNGTTGSSLVVNGSIAVLASGYTPQNGDVFNLLDWTGFVTANFSGFDVGTNYRDGSGDNTSQFDLPDISGSGLTWDVSRFATSGNIAAVSLVPEPGRMVLTIAAGVAALFVRRRRRPITSFFHSR